jgi:predicted transposase YbfD/YdcC
LTALAEGVAIREQRRQTSKSRRLYISSKPLSAAEVLATTRAHWSIENQLH